MGIDINSETIVNFSQLAQKLSTEREDRPYANSTFHRWRKPGLKGIRLEAIRIGSVWHTSIEAFQRFCDRLTQLEEDRHHDECQVPQETSCDDIERELEKEKW